MKQSTGVQEQELCNTIIPLSGRDLILQMHYNLFSAIVILSALQDEAQPDEN